MFKQAMSTSGAVFGLLGSCSVWGVRLPDSRHRQVALSSWSQWAGRDGGDGCVASLQEGAHGVPDSRGQKQVHIELQRVVSVVLDPEGGVHCEHLQ